MRRKVGHASQPGCRGHRARSAQRRGKSSRPGRTVVQPRSTVDSNQAPDRLGERAVDLRQRSAHLDRQSTHLSEAVGSPAYYGQLASAGRQLTSRTWSTYLEEEVNSPRQGVQLDSPERKVGSATAKLRFARRKVVCVQQRPVHARRRGRCRLPSASMGVVAGSTTQ